MNSNEETIGILKDVLKKTDDLDGAYVFHSEIESLIDKLELAEGNTALQLIEARMASNPTPDYIDEDTGKGVFFVEEPQDLMIFYKDDGSRIFIQDTTDGVLYQFKKGALVVIDCLITKSEWQEIHDKADKEEGKGGRKRRKSHAESLRRWQT